MGALKDAAKRNSNFLQVEKGESVVCEYIGFRLGPNYKDPSKDSATYQFRVNGQDKYWTNSNAKIMLFFDNLNKHTWIRLMRGKWISKDTGVEDTSKSSYEVIEVDSHGTPVNQSTAGKEEKAWDE
jgi:hypothetical protein